MYVPEDFPSPSDPRHGSAVAALVANAAMSLGGRTLVLTTTLRAIAVIAQVLRQQLAQLGSSLEVLAQGEWPKLRLMERFRAGAGPQGGCILVASASFWEGFDVPGDALQLVVIDKLPFPRRVTLWWRPVPCRSSSLAVVRSKNTRLQKPPWRSSKGPDA